MDVVVVAAGTEIQTSCPEGIDTARRIVAADSGYDLARSLGLAVDVLVGDLDSISPEGLDHARSTGVRIIRHPRDKDRTDLELALDHVVDGDGRVVILGGRGGRLDHQLALVSILAETPARVEAWMGGSVLFVVRDRWSGVLAAGATCSIISWAGRPLVSSSGLRWPLVSEHLSRGSGRGVSNEALGGPAGIEIEGGTVLMIVDRGDQLT